MVSRGIINLILPEYQVNKCFIIPNSIIDYNTMDRHRTCSPCCLQVLGFLFSIGKISRVLNAHYHVSSNESRGLKIWPKKISCIWWIWEVKSSPVNSSLYNLPVNRILWTYLFKRKTNYWGIIMISICQLCCGKKN